MIDMPEYNSNTGTPQLIKRKYEHHGPSSSSEKCKGKESVKKERKKQQPLTYMQPKRPLAASSRSAVSTTAQQSRIQYRQTKSKKVEKGSI
jgi:hypothetical protein